MGLEDQSSEPNAAAVRVEKPRGIAFAVQLLRQVARHTRVFLDVDTATSLA